MLTSLNVVSWNIAAINNNPFEYWITHSDEEYNSLMQRFQDFLDNPRDKDILLREVFTQKMLHDLLSEMREKGIGGVDEVENIWMEDYSVRPCISGFLLDKAISIKRLVSMPDRITNIVNNADGTSCVRPSIISTFTEDMACAEVWWKQWKNFMFHTTVHVHTKSGGDGPTVVCKLIEPILRSKYPAITLDEQVLSIPLQLLCLALFDAVLLYVLNTVAPGAWQPIKWSLTDALIKNKGARTCAILRDAYAMADIIFIQEAAAAFQTLILSDAVLSERYILLRPGVLDGKRDQNSFILARRSLFNEATAMEITDEIKCATGGTWLAPGDLLAVTIRTSSPSFSDFNDEIRKGSPSDELDEDANFLLASFHGDSNGLSTQPFLQALNCTAREVYPNHRLVMGLDANTHTHGDRLNFGVSQFRSLLEELGLSSCWDSIPKGHCDKVQAGLPGSTIKADDNTCPANSAAANTSRASLSSPLAPTTSPTQAHPRLCRCPTATSMPSSDTYDAMPKPALVIEPASLAETNVTKIATTCTARTCLQTQVTKAVRFADRAGPRQQHLKDWIVFYPSKCTAVASIGEATKPQDGGNFTLRSDEDAPNYSAARDNTGGGPGAFLLDTVFPTMEFPSDHAIVFTTLEFFAQGEQVLDSVQCSNSPTLLPAPSVPRQETCSLESILDSPSWHSLPQTTWGLLWGWWRPSNRVASITSAISSHSPATVEAGECESCLRSRRDLSPVAKDAAPRFKGTATLFDYWNIRSQPEDLFPPITLPGVGRRYSRMGNAVVSDLGGANSEQTGLHGACHCTGRRQPLGNLQKMLHDQFRTAACGIHEPLDLVAASLEIVNAEEGSIWILFTATPLSMALCKGWFRAIQMVITLLFLAWCLNAWYIAGSFAEKGDNDSAISYRFIADSFVADGSTVGGLNLTQIGIIDTGLLWNGYPVQDSMNVTITASTIMLAAPRAVWSNGWWLTLRKESRTLKLPNFTPQYSSNGLVWYLAWTDAVWAISGNQWEKRDFKLQFTNDLDSVQNEIIIIFDHSAPFEWLVGYVGGVAMICLGQIAALIFGRRKQGRSGTIALACGILFAVLLRIIGMVWAWVTNHWANVLILALWAVHDLGVAVTLLVAEWASIHMLALNCLSLVGMEILLDLHYMRPSRMTTVAWWFHEIATPSRILAFVLGVMWLLFVSSRRFFTKRVQNLVQEDYILYLAAWKRILADNNSKCAETIVSTGSYIVNVESVSETTSIIRRNSNINILNSVRSNGSNTREAPEVLRTSMPTSSMNQEPNYKNRQISIPVGSRIDPFRRRRSSVIAPNTALHRIQKLAKSLEDGLEKDPRQRIRPCRDDTHDADDLTVLECGSGGLGMAAFSSVPSSSGLKKASGEEQESILLPSSCAAIHDGISVATHGRSHGTELGPLVESLDQLYLQAVGMHGLLIAKVQQWAFAANGSFPVQHFTRSTTTAFTKEANDSNANAQMESCPLEISSSEDSAVVSRLSLVEWRTVAEDQSGRERVQWAQLKQPERAMEKLLRSYNNDPSRLLDVCRQMIIFDSPEQLLTCLEMMSCDREVVLVRVKNRLHDGYDVWTTAGYRDVLVNLRVVTEQTRELGIDTHICEVQLALAPLVEQLTPESHRRYIILRNVRSNLRPMSSRSHTHDFRNNICRVGTIFRRFQASSSNQVSAMGCSLARSNASSTLQVLQDNIDASMGGKVFPHANDTSCGINDTAAVANCGGYTSQTVVECNHSLHDKVITTQWCTIKSLTPTRSCAERDNTQIGNAFESSEEEMRMQTCFTNTADSNAFGDINSGPRQLAKSERSTSIQALTIDTVPMEKMAIDGITKQQVSGKCADQLQRCDDSRCTSDSRRTSTCAAMVCEGHLRQQRVARHVEQLLQQSYASRCQQHSKGRLDERLRNLHALSGNAGAVTLLLTSSPIAAALSRRGFITVLFFIAAAFSLQGLRAALVAEREGLVRGRHFRFIPAITTTSTLDSTFEDRKNRKRNLSDELLDFMPPNKDLLSQVADKFYDKVEISKSEWNEGILAVPRERKSKEFPIKSVELLFYGFAATEGNSSSVTLSESALTISYSLPVEINGWRIVSGCGTKGKAGPGKYANQPRMGTEVSPWRSYAGGADDDANGGQEVGRPEFASIPFVVQVSVDGDSWQTVQLQPTFGPPFLLYAREAPIETFYFPLSASCLGENNTVQKWGGYSRHASTFDLRVKWNFVLGSVIVPFLDCMMCIALAICGIVGRETRGPLAIAACTSIEAICFIASATGYVLIGRAAASASLWVLAAAKLLWTIIVVRYERFLQLGMFLHGMLVAVSDCVEVFAARRNWSMFTGGLPIFAMGFLLFWFMMVILQAYQRLVGRFLIRRDERQYCALWEQISRADALMPEPVLPRLLVLTQRLSPTNEMMARQRLPVFGEDLAHWQRLSLTGAAASSVAQPKFRSVDAIKRQSSGAAGRISKTSASNAAGTKAMVASLDQLYLQASGIYIFLKAKVQEWALASHGCFPVTADAATPNQTLAHTFGHARQAWQRAGGRLVSVMPSQGEGAFQSHEFGADQKPKLFMEWEDLLKDAETRVRVQWARLKSPGRALEKLLRSYNKDPSQLLDVCRQAIVFRSPEHLLLCLETISRDPEVVIVRVKNRLHEEYDAWTTAGYRDVLVNLRVVTPQTRDLGLEMHVCEVQLVLEAFAHVKSDEGHRRYITFRDKIGM